MNQRKIEMKKAAIVFAVVCAENLIRVGGVRESAILAA
jgi:hypothetical protein